MTLNIGSFQADKSHFDSHNSVKNEDSLQRVILTLLEFIITNDSPYSVILNIQIQNEYFPYNRRLTVEASKLKTPLFRIGTAVSKFDASISP